MARRTTPSDRPATLTIIFLLAIVVAGTWSHAPTASEPPGDTEQDSGRPTWARSFDLGFEPGYHSVLPLAGGQLVVVTSAGKGLRVLRLDELGRPIWASDYGILRNREIKDGASYPDGALALAGEYYSDRERNMTAWLLRLDSSGDIAWEREVLGGGEVMPSAVATTPDGGVVAAGWTPEHGWVARFDAVGRCLWKRQLVRSGEATRVRDVVSTSDGGVVLSGDIGRSIWVARLAPDGRVMWSRTLGGRLQDMGLCVAVDREGRFVVAGMTTTLGAGSRDVWLLRFDAAGEIVWQETIGGALDEVVTGLAVGEDGAIWVAALSSSFEEGAWMPWLIRVSRDGTVETQATYSPAGAEHERGRPRDRPGVAAQVDGGAVLAASIGQPFPKLWVVEVGPAGELASGCDVRHTTAAAAVPTSATPVETTVEIDDWPVQLEPTEAKRMKAMITEEELCAPAMLKAQPDRSRLPADDHSSGEVPEAKAAPAAAAAPEERLTVGQVLMAGRYDSLEEYAKQLIAEQTREPDGKWILEKFYDAFLLGWPEFARMSPEEYLALFDGWVAARPNSTTARIALAAGYASQAWEARGGGSVDEVTDHGWTEFYRLQQVAWETLVSISDPPPNDPHYYCLAINTGSTVGVPAEGLDALFEQGRAIAPDYLPIYLARVNKLQPKWGGAPDAVAEFASRTTDLQLVPRGDELYAGITMWAFPETKGQPFDEYGLDWERTRRGLQKLLEQDPEDIEYAHFLARFACLAGDRTAAAEAFRRPAASWFQGADYYWGSKADYDHLREWAIQAPATEWAGRDPREWPDMLLRLFNPDAPQGGPQWRSAFLIQGQADQKLLVTVLAVRPELGSVAHTYALLTRDHDAERWALRKRDGKEAPLTISRVSGPAPQGPYSTSVSSALLLAVASDGSTDEPEALGVGTVPRTGDRLTIVGCEPESDPCRRRVLSTTAIVPSGSQVYTTAARPEVPIFKALVEDGEGQLVEPGAVVVDKWGRAVGVVEGVHEPTQEERARSLICSSLPFALQLSRETDAPDSVKIVDPSKVEWTVNELLLVRAYDELDRLAEVLRKDRLRLPSGTWALQLFYSTLGETVLRGDDREDTPDLSTVIAEWRAKRPSSVPAIVATVAGLWSVLLHGNPGLTPDQRDAMYQEVCAEAIALFDVGRAHHPDDPVFYCELLKTLRACGRPPDSIEEAFRLGVQIVPTFDPLYLTMASMVRLERGALAESEFAKTWADRAGAEFGDSLYARIALDSPFRDVAGYREYQYDGPRLRSGLLTLHRRFPAASTARDFLMWLSCLEEDKEVAAALFSEPGSCPQQSTASGVISTQPSRYWSRAEFSCELCRQWALSAGDGLKLTDVQDGSRTSQP